MTMKNQTTMLLAITTMIALATLATANVAQAQNSGISRTELQRHDMGTKGIEAVQVRIDFEPGAVAGNHNHPGEEIIYVLEGLLEYHVKGKAPVILKAGEVLFIPAGTIHSAKNIGTTKGSELATYIVKKDKPLVAAEK
jgi:quercetin dioxygenase-like cupin family protein